MASFNHPGSSAEDEWLFFGSVQCFFEPAPGTAFVYNSTTVTEAPEAERTWLKASAIARQRPLASLGEDYSHLLVDAVPVADLKISRSSDGVETWPEALRVPLLKVPSGKFQGVASGIRSALWSNEGKWYRLKGCGNNSEGFIIVPVQDDVGAEVMQDGQPLQKIRGASYVHTATIELHSSAKVDTVARRCGMACANVPLGWYEYCLPDTPLPKVVRCCSVFQTFGDRRLADHVLRGLELLLPLMASSAPVALGSGAPIKFPDNPFGGARPGADGFDEMQQTHMIVVGGGGLECPLSSFADISQQRLVGLQLPTAPDVPRQFHEIWKRNCAKLTEEVLCGTEQCASLVGYLYWRFGWECGTFCRVLREEGICWGTYADGTGYHCNAHGNNMVLAAEDPAKPERPFTMPLDFDMAYTRDTFAFSEDEARDRQMFADNAEVESVSMLRDLGGAPDSTGTKNDHAVPPALEPLRWALRDTMVRAWLGAFRGEADTLPHDAARAAHAYALLRLALVMTHDVIG